MFLGIRNLQKLVDEGFIKLEEGRLEIIGDLYAHVDTVGVYGGGISIPTTELTFNRDGRRQTIECDLCEILELADVNGKKVKITVEVVDAKG